MRLPVRSWRQPAAAAWVLAAAFLSAGYLCLTVPPVDAPVSRTVAPVLLCLAYCLLIPLGLLLTRRDSGSPSAGAAS